MIRPTASGYTPLDGPIPLLAWTCPSCRRPAIDDYRHPGALVVPHIDGCGSNRSGYQPPAVPPRNGGARRIRTGQAAR